MKLLALMAALLMPSIALAETFMEAGVKIVLLPDRELSAELARWLQAHDCMLDSDDRGHRDQMKNDVSTAIYRKAGVSRQDRDRLDRDLERRMDSIIEQGIAAGRYIADEESTILWLAGC